MRYNDSNIRSGEILRLVLPGIARHCGNYTPVSYAVWYEHFAGLNIRLTGELDRRLQEAGSLDAEALEALHDEHIQKRDTQASRALQKSLEMLAQRLAQAAADSSGGVEKYARALEAGQSELQSIGGAEELQKVLNKLVQSTQDASKSAAALRAELDSTQAELRSMRDRVGHLQSEAVKDPLTGLLNRRGFDQAVAALLAEIPAAMEASAVLMLDLDHFKRVNDTYGHLFGDQVLAATAKVLNGVIKGRDIAARFGGEEFVVLLPETPESGGVALAEQFRVAFSRARVRRAGSDKVIDQLSVSIGVAVPLPGETLESTIERADKALYRAKNDGRNCVRVATAG